ncbi:MAG: polysaccharide pyruvyl transferase family protein [Anaerolineales bacterium]|nr:polysaccharide pyruvyl transferase family protein [Anaerolineales bacterium]
MSPARGPFPGPGLPQYNGGPGHTHLFDHERLVYASPENWPPGDSIRPLFVSFHIANPAIAQPHYADYYRQHEPIGCRDVATVELLRQIGVEAYLSGCLTLTLQNGAAGRTDQIYMVDVPAPLCPLIPEQIRRNAIRTTHLVGLPANLQHRLPPRAQRKLLAWWYHNAPFLRSWKFRRARELLDCYRRAKLVITSRLHCALPCVAFGVPVVVLRKNDHDPRWTGSERYLPVYTPENIDELDWDHIPVASKPDTSELETRIRGAIQAYEVRIAVPSSALCP